MDIFTRLERALEGMIEGAFSRAFRTQLQPVEVARRLTRELESHRVVSVSATYVPNLYTVRLPPDLFTAFNAIAPRLLAELEKYLREYVVEHGFQTVGPVAVRLSEDASVKENDAQVDAANDANAVPSTPPPKPVLRTPPPTIPTRSPAMAPADRTEIISLGPPTALEIVSGEGVGKRFPLAEGLTIGRSNTSTIVLAERGVSRLHAEIINNDGKWAIRDLGSTNGTFINGLRVTEHNLRIGDKIEVGGTALAVK